MATRKGSCKYCNKAPRIGLYVKEYRCYGCGIYFCDFCKKKACPECVPGKGYGDIGYIQN